jgi:hypothetical protein
MANPFPPLRGQDGNGSGKTPPSSYGLWGDSEQGDGVYGSSAGLAGIGVQGEGVFGLKGKGIISGVSGESIAQGSSGVFGLSAGGNGVWGESSSSSSPGVRAQNNGSGPGVRAQSASGIGIHAIGGGASSNQGFLTEAAVFAEGGPSYGILATSTGENCIRGINNGDGFGVVGVASNAGVAAFNVGNNHQAYLASDCCAAYFVGEVAVIGKLSKASGGFLIDHPLDPSAKYFSHSFVESPEMKNVYDGMVVLDANGEAVVDLPTWFESLNSDFRYQLTPIGTPGPNLYIAEEVFSNRFKIAGGTPMMKVSWQVTGIRQDAWAKAHPMQVEEDKSVEERGFYLHPELYGAPREQSIARVRHPQKIQQTP